MLEVADILRLHGQSFRATHRLAPWQLKALADIERCRTAYFGGHVAQCDCCGHQHYSYHSCRNRHCPKCHGQQTQRWLDKQRARLLPVGYYLLTFTLPASLRPLATRHPRAIYNLLLTSAVAALQKLARDPQWVGGTVPVLAVLHTWTRTLLFHPHVHLLVPAGGLCPAGTWVPARHPQFLVPGYALSRIFRAKFKAGLAKGGRLPVNHPAWQQPWNVHCRHAGSGAKVLDYLARYVFRIAIANSRLRRLENGQVTFSYRDGQTQQLRELALPAHQFLERFVQHVLPKGLVKVRSYGLWSAAQQAPLAQVQHQLAASAPATADLTTSPAPALAQFPRCPQCQVGRLLLTQHLRPRRKWPP